MKKKPVLTALAVICGAAVLLVPFLIKAGTASVAMILPYSFLIVVFAGTYAFLSKKYKKHPDKLVTENDERGQAINGKANAAAYGFSICALAAMSYVFALTDNSLAFYISLGALWLSFIAQYAFKKYYAKKM